MEAKRKQKGFFGKLWLGILKLLKMDLIERRNLAGYVFVIPLVLGLALIFLPALFQTVIYSVSENAALNENIKVYVGFIHYKSSWENLKFLTDLFATLRDIVINFPVILLFSFFMAMLLNKKHFPGRTFFRIVFFLPVIIYTGFASEAGMVSSSNELASVAAQVFADPAISGGGSSGMTSGIQSVVGMAMSVEGILQSLSMGTWLMNFINLSISRLEWIIQSSGVQIIVFLAALQSIPTAVFEAASVEGLTSWEMFWKITLPMISSFILVNAIYTIVDSFTSSRYVLWDTIRDMTYTGNTLGSGSALSVISFICIIVIIGLISLLITRYVFYNE